MTGPLLPNNILDKMTREDRERLGKVGKTTSEIDQATAVKLERELHKLMQNELNRRQIFAVHSRTDKKTTQQPGVPDFIMALWAFADSERPGPTPVAVEVKVGANDLSDEQKAVRDDMVRDGWTYRVVRSFEEFRALLAEFQT